MADSKRKLLQKMTRAREAMQSVVQRIDPQMKIYPSWTIKEMLAHIAGWDEGVTLTLTAHLDGREAVSIVDDGIDMYNEQSVAKHSGLTFVQTRHAWHFQRARLRGVFHKLSSQHLHAAVNYPWGGRGTIHNLIGGLIAHEYEHAIEIEQLLDDTRPRLPER